MPLKLRIPRVAQYAPPRLRLPEAKLRPAATYSPPSRGALRPPVPTLPEPAAARQRAAPVPVAPPSPYVDFARRFTAEGGIAISYKDLDERWWRMAIRIALWLAATGAEAYYVAHASPLVSPLLNLLLLLAVAGLNWLIVRKPVEVTRTIEIRRDCMILEGRDVFWQRFMEGGFPRFQPNPEGHQVLCGIYGTRWVEYLTVRRFDELDRSPEVLAAHLQAAMEQQWSPLGRGSG